MRTCTWLIGLMLTVELLSAQSAAQILDQTARTYSQMRSLRVQSRMTISMRSSGQMGEMNSTTNASQLAMAMRPNLVRFETTEQGQGLLAFAGKIRCDGKTLYTENALLQQTLQKPAPKSLREIYTEQNLGEAGYTMLGLDPLYLMAGRDWRKMATSPRLLRRERVANRETYKIGVKLQPPGELATPGMRATQTVWIGVKDRLIWKSEIVMSISQAGNRMTMRFTETFTRQEVNPNIQRSAFAYKLPEGFKLVERFEMPDLSGEAGKLKGQPAPEFTLKDLQGKEVRLADYKGKVVVLNIFAHWCGPCRAEAPELEKDIWRAFREKDVVVLGVATWAHDNPSKRAQEFAKEFNLTFPVLVDAQNSVATQYKVSGVPTTFVIDKEGVIREVIVGADVKRMKQAIESLL
jgi:peroxiredoxin/outer membrane lipoprotein-sorting protein